MDDVDHTNPQLAALTLSEDQAAGVDLLVDRIRAAAGHPSTGRAQSIFLLAGAAGTGKTTLAAVLLDLLVAPFETTAQTAAPFTWGETRLLCPTWKAALRLRDVLRRLGVANAAPTSIHAAVYRGPDEVQDDEDDKDGAGDGASAFPSQSRRQRDKLTFSEIVIQPDVRFVVVDEASMPNVDLVRDLCTAFPNAIVLGIGDHCQLPPVEGAPGFDLRNADVVLDRIHRQAEGSPVIALATRLRTGGNRSRDLASWLAMAGGDHGFRVVPVTLEQVANALAKRMGAAFLDSEEPDTDPLDSVTIAPTNKTRLVLNILTRKALGLPGYPRAEIGRGEVVLGLGNNPSAGWYNGSFGIIVNTPTILCTVYDRGDALPLWTADVNVGTKDAPHIVHGVISGRHWAEQAPSHWRPLDEQRKSLAGVSRVWFKQQQSLDERLAERAADGEPVRRVLSAGSGYCITGHKAQGSQWKRGVLLLDYAGWLKADEWRYWYTALTRFETPPTLAVPK